MSLLSVFDDRDSAIVFSQNPSWARGGTDSDFDGTSTWATSPGATFTFEFTGVGVRVFGLIQSGPSGPKSAYRIDGGDAQVFTAVPPVGVDYIYQQLFFNRSGLSGEVLHTLSVTALMVANATYFVDYIEVQSAPTVTTTLALAGSMTTSTTTWTDVSSINTSIVASSASGGYSATTTSPNTVDTTRSTPTTPIVEGVLGGIILLLLAAAFLRWRRNRARYLASLVVHSATVDTPPIIDDDADNRFLIS